MSTGDTPYLVALDYPGRRDDSRIDDLELDRHGFRVQHLLTDPLPLEIDATRYAQRLIERLEADTPVAAVLSYCMAGPIAHEVALLLTERQGHPPRLLLVEASHHRPEVVAVAYRSSLAQFPPLPGTDGGITPESVVALVTSQPEDLVADMRRELERRAGAELVTDGEEPDEALLIAGEVAAHHMQFVVHLVAASNAEIPDWPGEALHIVSRDYPFDGEWPGARVTRVRRLDLSRGELLRGPEARELVLSWLTAEHAEPR